MPVLFGLVSLIATVCVYGSTQQPVRIAMRVRRSFFVPRATCERNPLTSEPAPERDARGISRSPP